VVALFLFLGDNTYMLKQTEHRQYDERGEFDHRAKVVDKVRRLRQIQEIETEEMFDDEHNVLQHYQGVRIR